jgi:hypothetical protein
VEMFPVGYRVEVEGRGLHPALAPPRVSVGGIDVTDLEFGRDGTTLRGKVTHSPPNTSLVIDYGFTKAEAILSNRTAWWHWIRPTLLLGWTVLDRLVRKGISLLP